VARPSSLGSVEGEVKREDLREIYEARRIKDAAWQDVRLLSDELARWGLSLFSRLIGNQSQRFKLILIDVPGEIKKIPSPIYDSFPGWLQPKAEFVFLPSDSSRDSLYNLPSKNS
jgi:hypothetical protein